VNGEGTKSKKRDSQFIPAIAGTLDVVINNKTVNFLVDTGSGPNLIKRSALPENAKIQPYFGVLSGISNESVSPLGVVQLTGFIIMVLVFQL